MSIAVLESPKMQADRDAVMRGLLDNLDFIDTDRLIKINAFAESELNRQIAEYKPHSFDDLRDDVKQAIIDAENGVNVYGPYDTVEEAMSALRERAHALHV